MLTLALAGDTMLGRRVGERLAAHPGERLVAPEVVEAARAADAVVCNLECAISDRGERWPDPAKPFFFRAPPAAVEVLSDLGVGCVTLANNHALDYGEIALGDTLRHLDAAGIAHAGAGATPDAARAPAVVDVGGTRVAVVGVTDHPRDFAVSRARAGVAFAPLAAGVPGWLRAVVHDVDADLVVVSPHWGPNMVREPLPHIRAAAEGLRAAGADLVAGHSAHVFHGVRDGVLFDLGDFLDDYAADPWLRNDLGLLWFATFDGRRLARVVALPLHLGYCWTELARGDDARWVVEHFRAVCAALGTEVEVRDGRLVIEHASWTVHAPRPGQRRSR